MWLTVLFNDPYWIGVLEVEVDQRLYAATHIFGAVTSDQEICNFVPRDLLPLQARMLDHTDAGVLLSAQEATEMSAEQRHPKRVLRDVRRQVAKQGLQAVSSKAYEAMRLQIEQGKRERQIVSREERDAEREHRRDVARAKARAKHRGH